ncbi:MAG: VPLPA-CTERM sorting domain-containing protein [Sphingomonadales bacterium]|nr:VPLPA-CTERM sorting domain-containing protein [Sphingomonadales bacterium]
MRLDYDVYLTGSGADFIALESILLWDVAAPVSLVTFNFTALPRASSTAMFLADLTVLDLLNGTEEDFQLSQGVEIALPAVPLPAGGVLILSALVGLGALRLRRKQTL